MIYTFRKLFFLTALLAVSLITVDQMSAQPTVDVKASASEQVRIQKSTVIVPNCSIDPLHRAKVASDRPGVLAEMNLEEGDEVRHGQVIARLRDDVARAAVAIAKKQTENDIDIRLAQKTSEVAIAELEQAKQMNAGPDLQVVTRYELRRLKLSAEQTELQIEQAKIESEVRRLQFEEANSRLNEHIVKSPIDGMVTRRFLTSGESVQQGSEIAEITNFNILKIEGFVNVQDAYKIKVGDPVVVRLESSGLSAVIHETTFNGKIRFIDGSATAVTQQVRVWAEVYNTDRLLLPGLRATMVIQSPSRTAQAN